VRAGDGIVFAADVYERFVNGITERLRRNGTLTLAEARDMLGTSRRYAQALLERLDAERITRRVGDARVLR
jgi:selenocysteine-specific elongation factor